MFLNLLNPAPYVYWSLVGGPLLLSGWRETPVSGIGFLAGFYGMMTSSMAGIILLLMHLSGFLVFWRASELRTKLTLCFAAGLAVTVIVILKSGAITVQANPWATHFQSGRKAETVTPSV